MAKGDGSVTEVRRGVWRVRVEWGIDPMTGKRVVKSRNVHGTKADARRVRDEMRQERKNGLLANGDKMTLGEFVEIWAETRRTSGRARLDSIDEDRARLKHVVKYLGGVALPDISAAVIEQVYALIRQDSGLSGTSLNRIHTLLKNVFRKAVDYGFVSRNPCDRVEAPKRNEPDRRALNASECARLASCLDDAEELARAETFAKERRQVDRGNLFGRSSIRGACRLSCIQVIRIALATGMRRGEIIGLEWGHIDLEGRTITVAQTRTKKGENKPPKTKAGIRVVHIDGNTASCLRRWKSEQASLLRRISVLQNDATPVCCTDSGGYIDTSNFERFWRAFREQYGFEGLKLHELRHTQATQLLANGVDVKTVQTRMGHANARITLDWYAHAVPENDAKAADLMGNLLAKQPEGKVQLLDLRTA